MKYFIIFFLTFPFFCFSQELTTSNVEMSTIKIVHVNNNEVYRIAHRGGAYDYLKKNIDGEEVASIQLTNDDINTRCRGAYYRDNHIYSIMVKDNDETVSISLLKLDMNLNEVDKKEIYSGNLNDKNSKSNAFFDYNDKGFVLFRNFTKRKDVYIESYTYNFESEALSNGRIEFRSNEDLAVIDFEISSDLQSVLILDVNASFGDLKKRTLKSLETYLVHLDPKKGMKAKKLSEDENYYHRSFDATFDENELVVANLKFNSPSNIFAGYELSYYERSGNELNVSKTDFYSFDDYTSRKEWGPLLEEIQKEYEKNKDKDNVDYRHFGALEITDLIVEKSAVFLIVRNVVKGNEGIQTGSSSLTFNAQLTSKKYREFQITKLDTETKTIDWWRLVYNAPRSNGRFFDTDIAHAYGGYRNLFWEDTDSKNHSTLYYILNEGNQIKLIYPSYSGLYKDGMLKQELDKQKTYMNYDVVGITSIDKENGNTESSILVGEIDGAKGLITTKVTSLKGFYPIKDKIIIPLETPVKRTSILHVVEK